MLSERSSDVLLAAITNQPLVPLTKLASELTLTADSFAMALSELVSRGEIKEFGRGDERRLLTVGELRHLHQLAQRAVSNYHARRPLRAGMPQEELRSRLRLDASSFGFVADQFGDISLNGATVRIAGFVPTPSPQQREAIDQYLHRLRSTPSGASTDRELDGELLAYLVETGSVVDTGDGMIFDASAFDAMTRTVQLYLAAHGSITLAEARDLLGSGRKIAQALLEHLDRLRLTRRAGDARVLR